MRLIKNKGLFIYLNDNTEEKIYSFINKYKDGWGFGMGEGIKIPIILRALDVYRFGKNMGFAADASPILNGGVNIFFFLNKSEDSLQVSISFDSKIDIEWQRGMGQEYEIITEKENANFLDIRKTLNEIRGICPTSGSYQLRYTTSAIRDFQATALPILQKKREGVFQSSILNVQYAPRQTVFATTSGISIQNAVQ